MSDKLTPEQEARIPEFSAKWLKIGLCTDPTDFERAKDAALAIYRANKLKKPVHFWLVDGPREGAELAARLKRIEKDDPDWKQTREKVEERLAAVPQPTEEEISSCKSDMIFGSLDAGWLAYYDFEIEVLGKANLRASAMIELAKCCGWWAPYSHNVIFQHRAQRLFVDESLRPHCADGPAIQRGDRKAWYWHGVKVDELVIERPHLITVEMIEAESNAEVKRVLIERFGEGRYITEAKLKPIHKDTFGTLYKKDDTVIVRVVDRVKNDDGTDKVHYLPVHPELRPIYNERGDVGEAQELTARNAVASTFAEYGKDYAPEVET